MTTLTQAPNPVPLSPRMSLGSRIVLMASLALNALFVGGLVSAVVRHGGIQPPVSAMNAQLGLGFYVATLPPDRKQAILHRIDAKRQAMGPIRREVRQAREDALAVLTADPFDKDRFLAAQTRLIEIEQSQRLGQRDILAEIAWSMTPEERRAYINWRGGPKQPPPKQ